MISLANLANTLDSLIATIAQNAYVIGIFLAVLWGVHFINWLCGYRLNLLGVHPRKLIGIPGILLSPLLHSNLNHLLMNSIPLAILAALISVQGTTNLYIITLCITLICNIFVWCVARNSIHIGASGLVMGYWSYLLMNVYQHKSLLTIIVAGICLYFFAGLFINLFPSRPKVSWESHVFGFLAGIIVSFFIH